MVTVSYRDSQVEFVEIHSRLGEPCRLRNPWNRPCQLYSSGRSKEGSGRLVEGDVLVFETEKGHVYRLLPQGAQLPELRQIAPPRVMEPTSYSFPLADGNSVGATLGRPR